MLGEQQSVKKRTLPVYANLFNSLVHLQNTMMMMYLVPPFLSFSWDSFMIGLPSVAFGEGVCLYCTPTPTPILTTLFESLGGCVSLETESQMETCMVSTCMQGPLYGIMRRQSNWLVRNAGLSPEKATYLITKQYVGMVQDADRRPLSAERLDDLVEEQTPGGLNEQALSNLDKQGGLSAFDNVMDAVSLRIQGKSDGSLPKDGSTKD